MIPQTQGEGGTYLRPSDSQNGTPEFVAKYLLPDFFPSRFPTLRLCSLAAEN
jgi:hypothetical protein